MRWEQKEVLAQENIKAQLSCNFALKVRDFHYRHFCFIYENEDCFKRERDMFKAAIRVGDKGGVRPH